jgi:hypothetical protein
MHINNDDNEFASSPSRSNDAGDHAAELAVQVFFCKFREGDFSVVVITLSG